eukprot:TRINITY_DN4425_c0_g1_i3.p1 TRINITY_DN4425_c0_g1~~TRINITY_DN4425_c0_g1_i3.p1  ORF type:complete len:272 (-),score=12.41 TRINITY_DN4425_c0_g1_i3:221-1036(-)
MSNREPRAVVHPDRAQIRRDVQRSIVIRIRHLTEQSPFLSIVAGLFCLAQAIATAVVFALHWEMRCSEPIRIWLLVYGARVACSALVYFVFSFCTNLEVLRYFHNAHVFFNGFGFIWFVLGNYLFFDAENCRQFAPDMYKLMTAFLVLGYVALSAPCLVLLCVVLSYPCVPCIVSILARLSLRQAEQQQATLLARLQPKTYQPVAGSAEEDNTCVICSEEYQPDEELRVLPCRHVFHAQCIENWVLGFRPTCPCCRYDLSTNSYPSPENAV